jgi:hypothetical protein
MRSYSTPAASCLYFRFTPTGFCSYDSPMCGVGIVHKGALIQIVPIRTNVRANPAKTSAAVAVVQGIYN